MEKAIAITLPTDIKLALDSATRQEKRSLDELIVEAIREYLFFRQFRLLREQMIPKARAQDIYTEQDVFERVS